ncbi:MAG: hypothetical protein C4522_00370 [Desulfobacteraceae bacterium]|nr:MAG: hypothetical protein C4522_00370 [Desulfobacteraceae bacterium]
MQAHSSCKNAKAVRQIVGYQVASLVLTMVSKLAAKLIIERSAVYSTLIQEQDICFYTNGRNEQEFVCNIQRSKHKLKKEV